MQEYPSHVTATYFYVVSPVGPRHPSCRSAIQSPLSVIGMLVRWQGPQRPDSWLTARELWAPLPQPPPNLHSLNTCPYPAKSLQLTRSPFLRQARLLFHPSRWYIFAFFQLFSLKPWTVYIIPLVAQNTPRLTTRLIFWGTNSCWARFVTSVYQHKSKRQDHEKIENTV